jgi:Tryptophan-associated transmembrane protein (Trp_oprn_chp)
VTAAAAEQGATRGRRELGAVLVTLGLASAVLLLAAGRTWVRTAADTGRLEAARSQSGSSLAPGLPALALVGLAGVVAVLATRGRLRQAVGVVVALAGLGALALAVAAPPDDADATGWRWVAVVAAAVVALTGVVVAVRGAGWPTMSGRYDAPAAVAASDPAAPPAGPAAPAAGPAADRSLWDAIERGDDPTT